MLWVMKTRLESEKHLLISKSPDMLIDGGFDLNEGEVIYQKPPEKLTYEFSEDPNDILQDNIPGNGISGLLLSNKVKEVFDSLDIDNVQYFATSLINTNGPKEHKGYFFSNIVGAYSVINMELSEVEESDIREGMIVEINSLVLKEIDEDEYPSIFMFKEQSGLILVKEHVKEAIEKTGLTGFSFYKPEEYSM